VYEEYRKIRGLFDKRLQAYWRAVDAKREARKARRLLGQDYTADDYVRRASAEVSGPRTAARHRQDRDRGQTDRARAPASHLGRLPGQLEGAVMASSRPTTEKEFKRKYAQEALAVGLSNGPGGGIYALETGGQGTYEHAIGINPVTRQGRPISSALGYAQLLNANSTSELVKHGDKWVKRLPRDGRSRTGINARTRPLP